MGESGFIKNGLALYRCLTTHGLGGKQITIFCILFSNEKNFLGRKFHQRNSAIRFFATLFTGFCKSC